MEIRWEIRQESAMASAALEGREEFFRETDLELAKQREQWLTSFWGGRFYPIILELALKYRRWEVMEALLLKKKDHISTENLHTLVCDAARNDQTERLVRSAKFYPKSVLFKLALRAVVVAGNLHDVRRLMDDVFRELLDTEPGLGNILCSAASLAIKRGYVDIAQCLVAHESVKGNELSLYTVFQYAADNDDQSDSYLEIRSRLKTLLRGHVYPFLHMAAQSGSRSCFQKLLEYCPNMDINAVFSPKLFTPLHVAAYYGRADLVHLLLEHDIGRERGKQGASSTIDLTKTDSLGRTALHTAAGEGWLPVVVELLDRIELDARDNDGMTALHLAACGGHANVVRELMSRSGCLVNVQAGVFTSQMVLLESFLAETVCTSLDETPAFLDYVTFPMPSVVKSIFWSPGGFTPLHFAAVYGGKVVVEELLKHANVNVLLEDDEGLTAYDWADACGSGQPFLECLDESRKDEFLRKVSHFNLMRAESFHEEAKRIEQMKKRVEWCSEMGKAVSSKQWVLARGLVSKVSILKIEIDRVTWGCLLHAFEKATFERVDMCAGYEGVEDSRTIRENWTNMLREEVETIVLRLLKAKAFTDETSQLCLMWAISQDMVRIAQSLILSETSERTVNCNLPTPHTDIQTGFEVHSTPLELASRLKRAKIVQLMEQREDVKKAMYEDRQVYVDYANTMLVGAVLVAGLAYIGWLQPPMGYKDSAVNTTNAMVRLFSWFNGLGFILALATVIAGATGAMPMPSGQLGDSKKKALRAVSGASVLFVAAVVSVMAAFTAAGLAVLAERRMIMRVSASLGAMLGAVLLLWFINRLLELILGKNVLFTVRKKLWRVAVNAF